MYDFSGQYIHSGNNATVVITAVSSGTYSVVITQTDGSANTVTYVQHGKSLIRSNNNITAQTWDGTALRHSNGTGWIPQSANTPATTQDQSERFRILTDNELAQSSYHNMFG